MTKQRSNGLSRSLAVTAVTLAWLATGQAAGKGDKAFGEYLSGECVTCHQKSGQVIGGIPSIIGWPEDQFLAVMHAYQKGQRENQIMRTIASQFKEEELEALAAYFGSLKPPQ